MAGGLLPLLGVALVGPAAADISFASQSVHVLRDADAGTPKGLCGSSGLVTEGYFQNNIGGPSFNITVWVPPDSGSGLLKTFYNNSRFDWSTQIGNVCIGPLVLFPDPYWNGPPDRNNPDTGVGLAAEFGCDEEGHICAAGGLNDLESSTNGVLGWEDDDLDDMFIKIGVGRLQKPNISEGQRKYNPKTAYEVVKSDLWRVVVADGKIEMQQEVVLGGDNETVSRYGYTLKTTVEVTEESTRRGVVEITTTLRNRGSSTIRTPYYSRNLMTMKNSWPRRPDDNVNANWSVELESITVSDIKSNNQAVWNQNLVPRKEEVDGVQSESLDVVRPLTNRTTIKTEFIGTNDTGATAEWVAKHKDNNITISSTESTNNTKELYRYLFYASKNELSPVPMRMIVLAPGETATMTRKLIFEYEPGVKEVLAWVPEGWMLGTAICLMLGSTGISLQFKKKSMVFMDTFQEKRDSVHV